MKRRGFTLVELLAVIVIISVVALITIPAISKIVKGVKIGAIKQSTIGYLDAVKKAMIEDENSNLVPGTHIYYIYDANLYKYSPKNEDELALTVYIKGKKPADGGTITIDADGEITNYNFMISNYPVTVKDENGKQIMYVGKKGTSYNK